ncbi:MAG: GAF domain-containing protein [Gaiellaceae bacterium MAG52_C11]|nr:GAF domain-containing protein [Candidatus Gaiellasilicea maunaloa]
MDAHTQAVLFNAVPLLLLAALYLAVGTVLASAFRQRGRLSELGLAYTLVFPCFGIALGLLGVLVVVNGEPLGGHVWISLPAILLAAVPVVAFLANGADRGLLGSGTAAEERTLRDRELEAMERLSRALLDAPDESEIGRLLVEELGGLFELDIANLVVIEDDGARARILRAREGGSDIDPLAEQVIDLDGEVSGVGTAVREGRPFAVFDVASSPIVNRRLNELARVTSCAFVPVVSAEVVIGVVFAGVRRRRLFGEEELALMQSFAFEAGRALARVRSARELAEALERERVVSRITLEVRSRQELDELLGVAVEGIGRALDISRCFIRLGEPGEAVAVLAEWSTPGYEPIGDATRLPVVDLAFRELETIEIADVLEDVRLRDPELGDIEELTRQGTRAALATPIVASGRAIGVLGIHRGEPGRWSRGDVLLAEAVAREAAGAIQASRLLRDSERRIAEQGALLKASEALTSDLKFDSVISRLVEELLELVAADAADCWTLATGGGELVCRAVLGLPETEIGRRIPVEGTVGRAIATGEAVLQRDFARTEQPKPTANYAVFAEVMEAPIFSFGDIRGVLGVCSVEHGRFDESDLRLIEAFANLASIALRNAEAYEESARQAQIERGFYRIAAVLGEPLSTAATLDAVAQAAAESLGGDFVGVLRAVGGELVLSGAYELPQALAAFLHSSSEHELQAASGSGKVLASRLLREDTRFGPGLPAAAEAAGSRSLLAVPLAQPGAEESGLVLVFFREERTFTDEQLELARHIAGAARGALERSELYELERRSRSLAQRLASSSRELASELDPDSVLERVTRRAAEILEASGASARVLEGDELVVRAACGDGSAELLEQRSASTAWLVGDIVQSRSPRAIANVADDPRTIESDPMLAAGHAAYLGVPMIGPAGAVEGILAVYDRRPREWRDEESETLALLAGSAASARTNAELYQGVRHEQQRSEAILANVADGIVAVDRQGKVVLWNPAAEQITGVPTAAALGQTPGQALGRPLEAEGGPSGGNPRGGSRLVAVRRGGEEAWLSLSEAVMTDPAGAVAGRIFAFRDISADRAVEQMKSDFVSTVSHELRTPLTSIYGFAETLLRQDVLFGEAERETFLRYIASESERLTAIVDRLLSVAQLDTGKMSVELTTTDVTRIVERVVSSAESTLGQNGHTFVTSFESEPLAAKADAEKVGQVLAHLIDNAVRYSPAGGTVTIAARRTDGSVELRVEDEGEGIPRGEQERIFRKFYRGEAASQTVGAGATGLGLFLAEGLVSAMGGRIWVDSPEGRGAAFVVELPAAAREN